ncbi:MAG: hypothetical protein F7C09_01620 [Aeropyrum sp.]|nr:hypothetical protein [Aeropyrum sp.]
MADAWLRALMLANPSPKKMRKLLQRQGVMAVTLVVEVRSERAIGALARHYGARLLQLPLELLLEPED